MFKSKGSCDFFFLKKAVIEIRCEAVETKYLTFLDKAVVFFYTATKKLMVSCVYNTTQHTMD